MYPLLLLLLAQGSAPSVAWKSLDQGLDFGTIVLPSSARGGLARVRVLRIDPKLWSLEFLGAGTVTGTPVRTAKEWSQAYGLTAVINAGMFADDRVAHLGYVRCRGKIYNSRMNGYQSVASFDPIQRQSRLFHIFDLDRGRGAISRISKIYGSSVQNLRLIKRPGKNAWAQSNRRWSEAALAEDSSGRILFVFSRFALTVHDFCRLLLQSRIGVVAAQHLEGGPEAQLYIRAGVSEMEFFGSFETGFQENDLNSRAWPIPNVFGIRRR